MKQIYNNYNRNYTKTQFLHFEMCFEMFSGNRSVRLGGHRDNRAGETHQHHQAGGAH